MFYTYINLEVFKILCSAVDTALTQSVPQMNGCRDLITLSYFYGNETFQIRNFEWVVPSIENVICKVVIHKMII